MSMDIPTTRSFRDRMIGAAKLDPGIYEEVEADVTANRQAFAVVVLASLATGIGAGIGGLILNGVAWLFWGLLIGLGTSIAGWLLWALFAYWLGTRIFKGPETEATYGQLVRTLGFANSPGILRFFSFVPFVGGMIAFLASIWVLVAGVIAVRQALDFSTWRAIGTCVVGWIIYLLLVFLVTSLVIGVGVLF